MTINPTETPANSEVFDNISDFSFIYWKIDNTTWKIAPAPIATKIAGKAQHISVDVEANNEKKLAVLSCI